MTPAIPVIVLLVLLPTAVFTVETCGYLLHWGAYYRLGPAFHREQWQTRASREEAIDAVGEAMSGLPLSWRRRGDEWTVRFRWWDLSAWPRVRLHVKDNPHGAQIVYEVRPFISMALFLPLFLWSTILGIVPLLGAFLVTYIIVAYAVMWRWELRRLRRLQAVRERLSHIGLRICDSCGYDLHEVASPTCPECGGEAAGGAAAVGGEGGRRGTMGE